MRRKPVRALPSAPRMVLRMQLLEALARDVRVDLGRRDIGVPEQHLHHAQVGAVIEQVGGERMAQGVRGDPLLAESRLRRVA